MGAGLGVSLLHKKKALSILDSKSSESPPRSQFDTQDMVKPMDAPQQISSFDNSNDGNVSFEE